MDIICFFPPRLSRADGPTRDSDPEPPHMQLPVWFLSSGEAFCNALDAWLGRIGASHSCGLPFDQLGHIDSADISSSRKSKLKPPSRSESCSKTRLASRAVNEGSSIIDSKVGAVVGSALATTKHCRVPSVCGATRPQQDVFQRLFARFPSKHFFFDSQCSSCEVPGVLDLYSGNLALPAS